MKNVYEIWHIPWKSDKKHCPIHKKCNITIPWVTALYINIHILQSVPLTYFYLWCLRPDHNEIWHEDGSLDPDYRKTTLVRLPWQQLPW